MGTILRESGPARVVVRAFWPHGGRDVFGEYLGDGVRGIREIVTPRHFWRGVIVAAAYSGILPDSVSRRAMTARRTARFTTARLTARRLTALLTTRRFTARLFNPRFTARRLTAFLATRRFTARRFRPRLATALLTRFFAKFPSLNHRG